NPSVSTEHEFDQLTKALRGSAATAEPEGCADCPTSVARDSHRGDVEGEPARQPLEPRRRRSVRSCVRVEEQGQLVDPAFLLLEPGPQAGEESLEKALVLVPLVDRGQAVEPRFQPGDDAQPAENGAGAAC